MHELWQLTIVKLASCMTGLDSLDCDIHNHCVEVAQTSSNLEAIEKWVAVTEDVLINVGLWELRTKLQGMKEEIATIRGKWEEASCRNSIERWRLSKFNWYQELRSWMQNFLLMKPF